MKRLLLLTSLGLVAGLVWGNEVWLSAQQPFRQPVRRSTEPIRVERCRIQLKQRRTLASERAGILAFVGPQEGDVVRAEEQVVRLKDEIAKAAVEVADKEASNDVEIRYALKAFEVARVEYDKALAANRLVPGAVPDIEVRRLKLAADRAKLQIEQAQHRYAVALLKAKEARAQLDTFRVQAPFDGIVTRVFKMNGEAVRQGDPILEMVNTDVVRVEGYINIKAVESIKSGTYVRVKLDIPGVELPMERLFFEGRIAFVDVSVNPVTGQVRVWAEVANQDNVLRAGMTATMVIDPSRKAPPKTAAKPAPLR